MSILSRVKTWVDQEVLEASDLNAEFNAIVNNIIAGTTASVGVLQLEDSHASTSTTKAACPKNVKEAYDLAGTMLTKATFDANTFIYAVADNTPIKKTRAEILALLSGQAAADVALNTHKLTGVVDPTANQDAATKKYVDDNDLWTDGGAYYHPNNWSYMRILDSDRLDIANSTAFTNGFPWDDTVTYPGSTAGSMVNLGQESSSDGNPPLWVQKKFNKSSASATHYAGAGHFEVWKQAGSTNSFVSALTGHIKNECSSGQAIGLHGRAQKYGAGNTYAVWAHATRPSGHTEGHLHGIEINTINKGNNETFADTVQAPSDIGVWIYPQGATYPGLCAIGIGADSTDNSHFNGILFNTHAVRNVAGNGVGINMYSITPQYGIKFSSGSTANIYYADASDGLRVISLGNTISKTTGSWYFTRNSGGNAAVLDQAGNLSLDTVLIENAWTLDDKDMNRKWELMNTILDAYRAHDGSKLDPVLQVKESGKNENDKTTGIKYGKRPSDFIQIAIECIAELKERIAVLEKA